MKAVIQAGGKGTRVSSLTGGIIPKPMLEIDNYPILYHQIANLKDSGITDIIIIIGYLGEVIKNYFADGSKFGVSITYYQEDPEFPLGTAGALYYLKDRIQDDYIFLLADVFLDIDFQKMIRFHRENNAGVTLLTHPNSHPFDSDLVVTDGNKVLTFDSKENIRNYDYNNLVNAGVMIFGKQTFDLISEPKKLSYEKDIVIPLIKKEKVFSYKSTEYAKDMGTPERYEQVTNDYFSGITKKRNLRNKQKCIFLDRDGTINKYVGFLRNVDQLELYPEAGSAIREINNSEYLAIVVTNQPVIARGEVTFEGLDLIHKRMDTLLGKEGAYINDLFFCPHHTDKGFEGEIPELKFDCECRKPKLGMIKEAAKKYDIDLNESYIVGDSSVDMEMGKRAGLKTILLKTGVAGEDNKFEVTPDYIACDLLEGVNVIINKKEKVRKI